jgi:hypothetical protein
MKHVNMTSGGAGSTVAGHRVAQRYGTDDLVLLFCDTKGNNPSPHAGEDADTYRFLRESAVAIGVEPTILNAGEDIWQVYRRRRRIGSGYAANCSYELKQKIARAWLDANCDPDDTVVYLGIDWTEANRCEAQRQAYAHKISGCRRPRKCKPEKPCTDKKPCRMHRPCTPEDACTSRLERPWRVVFPLIEWQPMLSKDQVHAQVAVLGIPRQRLYKAGMQHANCGGFCVKAGKAQFARLLAVHPERYAYHEEQEQVTRDYLGKDVAVLNEKVTIDGKRVTVPLTLRAFREQCQAGTAQFDLFDIGGCGCMTDDPPDYAVEEAS